MMTYSTFDFKSFEFVYNDSMSSPILTIKGETIDDEKKNKFYFSCSLKDVYQAVLDYQYSKDQDLTIVSISGSYLDDLDFKIQDASLTLIIEREDGCITKCSGSIDAQILENCDSKSINQFISNLKVFALRALNEH